MLKNNRAKNGGFHKEDFDPVTEYSSRPCRVSESRTGPKKQTDYDFTYESFNAFVPLPA